MTDKTDQMAAKGFCSGPGKTNPNREFCYNNCDYLVLGAALEAVTGQDFETLVKQKLNQGLGLKSVGLAKPDAPKVKGYDGAKPYPRIYASTFGASAAMQGSAADMVRFDRALLGDTLLKAQEKALAWTGDPTLGYEALGVWAFQAELRGCSGPVDLVERRGDLGGIQVRNILAPGQGRALAVFTNDATVDFGEIWQGQGLTYELLSAAFCEGGDLPQAN
ncbi:MAG: hypothetical protein CFE28_04375 [Alphaproteobacteria bacterium PA2]|nr:MAG: hypothetical protein CFE28_04375 [Alphaproteobacteria bacterium PA2]